MSAGPKQPERRFLRSLVRCLLRLHPDGVSGVSRTDIEKTFFDRLRHVRSVSRLSGAVLISRELWNLLSTGVSLQLENRQMERKRPRPFAGFGDDIRFAVRNLMKAPTFSLGAIGMLAVGIGVNTAIYNVNAGMSRIVQRFEDPEKLAFLWGVEGSWQSAWVSGQDYLEWKASATAFRDMGVYSTATRFVTGNGEPQRISAVHASPYLLPMLGLTPEVGRLFGPSDIGATAPDVAVLTHRLWMERFGGEPSVLGQTVSLNDVPHTVIGVLPKSVEFEMLWREAGVFTPLVLNPAELTWEDRRYRVIGRLAEGATMEMAHAQLSAIAARLAEAHPETNSEVRARVEAFEDFFYSNDDKLAMALAMAGVVAVLLIACVNLANILLAKGTARQGEIAVRLAVGASRWRMIRGLLFESFILAIAGGAVGIYLGQLGTKLIVASFPYNPFLLEEVGLDGGLLVFVVAVSVAAALAFGLAPALLSTKVSLAEGVKESLAGASSGRARKRFRSWILVGQMALTVPLVLTCAIAYLNVAALERLDLGFHQDGLLTLQVDLPEHRYRNGGQRAEFFAEVLQATGTLPGVESAATGSSFPVGGGQRTLYAPMIVQGRETEVGAARGPYGFQSVSPGYFTTLGATLRSGRYFTVGDGPVDPPVAIVNEAFVRFYWPEEDALGKMLMPVPPESPGEEITEPVTVVGVVADFGARLNGDPPRPTLYRPFGQTPTTTSILIARTEAEPAIVFPRIRDAIRRLDGNVPVSQLQTSEAIVDDWLKETRVIAATLGLLGILALILATVGLYGMVAYSVAQRTYELGIRMVLGANRRSVRLSVMRSFLTLSGFGLVIGLLISVAIAAVMRSQLAMLQVSWIPSIIGIVGLLALVVVLASYLPARCATTIEPAVALRCE